MNARTYTYTFSTLKTFLEEQSLFHKRKSNKMNRLKRVFVLEEKKSLSYLHDVVKLKLSLFLFLC